MNNSSLSFERKVTEDWTLAVAEAAYFFPQSRATLYAALASAEPRVRAAAVAALNEADDEDAHDRISLLINDADDIVRLEALEFIAEFPRQTDVPILLALLLQQDACFHASTALQRLTSKNGPSIDFEATAEERRAGHAQWTKVLSNLGGER
jgi:HEAT repeat protein